MPGSVTDITEFPDRWPHSEGVHTRGYQMAINMGSADRTDRIVGGIALLSLIVLLEGNARWWGLVGLIPLFTGLKGWCPLYTVFGLSTRGGNAK